MKSKKFAIITGSSYGLGKEIALNFASKNIDVFLISRSKELLSKLSDECESSSNFFETDLSTLANFKNLKSKIIASIDVTNTREIILVNNASTINPIDRVENIDLNELNKAINLNITCAFLMSKIALEIAKKYNFKASIINISSGVSIKPVSGWSIYCASKAALNMLTYVLNEENKENDFYTVSINPGPLDTGMQKIIRETSLEKSPISSRFKEMKEKNMLNSPKDIAEKISLIFETKSFDSGSFVDFNQLS